MKEKVLQVLKPKAASLGFSKDEIESVATQIAGTIQSDATDEDISTHIDGVMPFLQLSQKAFTRAVNEQKKKEKEKPTSQPDVSKSTETDGGENDKFDKLMQLIENQGKQISSLLNKETTQSRREIYSAKLKDLPETLKNSKLKDFSRMSFENEDDFNAFVSETETEVSELVKEFSTKEISSMGQPLRGGKTAEKQASDKEIEAVLNQLNM